MKERISSPAKICFEGFFATAATLTSTFAAINMMEGRTPIATTFITAAIVSIVGEILSIKSNH